jgi:hypothetical protein
LWLERPARDLAGDAPSRRRRRNPVALFNTVSCLKC